MRTSTVLLSAATLACATASALLWAELRRERVVTAELTARLQQAPQAPAIERDPEVKVSNPREEPRTAAPAAATPAPNGPDVAASEAPVVQGTQEEWMARQRRLLNDPRYREAWREQQRIQAEGRREKMIQALGLSAEQADAIVDLGIDRQLSWQLQARPQSKTEDAARQQKERAEADERAYQARLLEVLGQEKLARYQEYIASSGSRQQVERLRSQLNGADPLRDDQVEPLIASMHSEQSRMSGDLQAFRETLNWDTDAAASMQKLVDHQTEAMKATQARIRTAAGAILSSVQMKQLDAMFERDLARHEAMLRMQRIQSKIDSGREAAAK